MTTGTEESPSVDADLKIEVVPVEPEQIQKFTSEDEFMELSVRLLVETASYVLPGGMHAWKVFLVGPRPCSRRRKRGAAV
jgi:hypothetical protein